MVNVDRCLLYADVMFKLGVICGYCSHVFPLYISKVQAGGDMWLMLTRFFFIQN